MALKCRALVFEGPGWVNDRPEYVVLAVDALPVAVRSVVKRSTYDLVSQWRGPLVAVLLGCQVPGLMESLIIWFPGLW